MNFFEVLNQYGATGAFFIAVATIIAVGINAWHIRHIEIQNKKQQNSSLGSAIAAELLDNAHTMVELYTLLKNGIFKAHKVKGLLSFQMRAYENLLGQVGNLGSSLSFMTVDVYGDIEKLKAGMQDVSAKELEEDVTGYQYEIQTVLVKALTTSIIVLLYADYLSGRRFLREVHKKRIIWIEKILHEFCEYADKMSNAETMTVRKNGTRQRFFRKIEDPADQDRVRSLFDVTDRVLKTISKEPPWKAQLIFRALSYKIMNTLNYLLEIEPHKYDLMSEQEFSEYL